MNKLDPETSEELEKYCKNMVPDECLNIILKNQILTGIFRTRLSPKKKKV